MAPTNNARDTRAAAARSCQLLLVDDDPSVISVLGKTLKEFGRLRFATSGLDALRMAQERVPDLILLDIEMPGLGGFEVCKMMKLNPLLADVPIIFITGHDAGELEVEALALGAADFICKPIRPSRVVARVRMHLRMKEMSDALRRSAYTDALTGLANRRQFDDMLHREWHRAERLGTPIALLLVDIDYFKRYNDLYGHPAGDRCLQAVAGAVRQAALRPADLAARYGGEEFGVVLPDTDAAGACHVARHLLDVMRKLALPHTASSVADHVTLSIGVSAFDARCPAWRGSPADSRFGTLGDPLPLAHLVESADLALYAAKAAGRRRACFLGIQDHDAPHLASEVHSDMLLPSPAAGQPSLVHA